MNSCFMQHGQLRPGTDGGLMNSTMMRQESRGHVSGIWLGLLVPLVLMNLLLEGRVALAQSTYVTDTFEITLRTGPSNGNKILKMLGSGTPVEVLGSDGDWTHVRAAGAQGWVLSRYLTRSVPAALQVERLTRDNEKLRSTMSSLSEESSTLNNGNRALQTRLERTGAELDELRQRYAALEKGAASYVELKKAHDDLVRMQAETSHRAEELASANKELSADRNLRWFTTGAGVVGASLLVGFAWGRMQRKKAGRIFM